MESHGLFSVVRKASTMDTSIEFRVGPDGEGTVTGITNPHCHDAVTLGDGHIDSYKLVKHNYMLRIMRKPIPYDIASENVCVLTVCLTFIIRVLPTVFA